MHNTFIKKFMSSLALITPCDGNISHDLWQGELKKRQEALESRQIWSVSF